MLSIEAKLPALSQIAKEAIFIDCLLKALILKLDKPSEVEYALIVKLLN